MHTFFELIGVCTTIMALFVFILMAMGVVKITRRKEGRDE